MTSPRKIALVTGASRGIGLAIAKQSDGIPWQTVSSRIATVFSTQLFCVDEFHARISLSILP